MKKKIRCSFFVKLKLFLFSTELNRNREFYKNIDHRPPFTYASLIRQVNNNILYLKQKYTNESIKLFLFFSYPRLL